MKILVLNGSPKGKNSITLQTVEYLKLMFPAHEWETLHVGQKIRALEKDFAPAAESLARAELVLFSYPVYTFIAPAQLHRFIELMKEHGVDVRGKWASQISTSKHFYDVTAHRYVMENAQDMGMRFVRGLSVHETAAVLRVSEACIRKRTAHLVQFEHAVRRIQKHQIKRLNGACLQL